MKNVKRFATLCAAAVVLATALGGCVIVPVPFGYGHHYYHR